MTEEETAEQAEEERIANEAAENEVVDFHVDAAVEDVQTPEEIQAAADAEAADAAALEEEKKVEMTPEAIAEAVAKGMASAPAPKVEEVQKELTQEEIDKALKTAKYTTEDLIALGMISADTDADEADTRTKVFNGIQQRVVEQAVATSQMLQANQAQGFEAQMAPLIQAHQQRQNQAMVDSFYTEYPALKDFEDVVKMAAGTAQAEGRLTNISNMQEVAKIIATDAAALVKKFSGTDISLSASQKSDATKPAKAVVKKAITPAGQAAGGRSQQLNKPLAKKDEAGEFNLFD